MRAESRPTPTRHAFGSNRMGLFLALLIVGVWVEPLWACPNCKYSLLSAGLEQAYAVSILLLLGVPLSLILGWSWAIYRMRSAWLTHQAAASETGRTDPPRK